MANYPVITYSGSIAADAGSPVSMIPILVMGGLGGSDTFHIWLYQ